MDPQAKEAFDRLQAHLEEDAVRLTRHARARLEERGFLWEDVAVVISAPDEVEDQGIDDEGFPKLRVAGRTALKDRASLVVSVLQDESLVVTLFWEA